MITIKDHEKNQMHWSIGPGIENHLKNNQGFVFPFT